MKFSPTEMHLLGQYELLDPVEDRSLRTFRARQASSGRIVLCHDLSSGPNAVNLVGLVVRYLRGATSRDRSLILDMIEESGSVYLITEELPGSGSLEDWLEAATPGLAATSAPKFDVQAEGATGIPSGPDPEKVVSPQSTVAPSEQGPSPPAELGGFTQLFRSPSPTVGSAPAVPSVVPKETELSVEPREFTQVFESYKVSGPLPSALRQPPAIPRGPQPGEFTKIFQGPDMSSRGVADGAPVIPAAAEPTEREGEFTRVFGSGSAKSLTVEPAFRPASADPSLRSGKALKVEATAEQSRPAGRPLEPAPGPVPSLPETPDSIRLQESGSAPSPKQPAAPLPSAGIPKVGIPFPSISRSSVRPAAPAPPAPRVPQPKPDIPKPRVPPVVVAPPSPAPALGRPDTLDERTSYLPLILILAGLALAVVALFLLLQPHH